MIDIKDKGVEAVLGLFENNPTEDIIERINVLVTVYIFGFFALIVGAKQHFGQPMQCMVPKETPESWSNYYHEFCFIQDKYIGSVGSGSTQYKATYYQWVPYVLLLQALCFMLPRVFWMLIGKAFAYGGDIESAVCESGKLRATFGEERFKGIQKVAHFVLDVINMPQRSNIIGPRLGSSRALFVYVISKWLYVLNAIFQFKLLVGFVGQDDLFWGFTLLHDIATSNLEDEGGFFPRKTLCDVSKLEIANLHSIRLECLLTMNYINEKVYMFLYFWLLFVVLINVFSAIKYTLILTSTTMRTTSSRIFMPSQEVLFSSSASDMGIRPTLQSSNQLADYFINKVLKGDGWLMLSFIRYHAGTMIAYEVVDALWKQTVQRTAPSKVHDSDSGSLYTPSKRANRMVPDADNTQKIYASAPVYAPSPASTMPAQSIMKERGGLGLVDNHAPRLYAGRDEETASQGSQRANSTDV